MSEVQEHSGSRKARAEHAQAVRRPGVSRRSTPRSREAPGPGDAPGSGEAPGSGSDAAPGAGADTGSSSVTVTVAAVIANVGAPTTSASVSFSPAVSVPSVNAYVPTSAPATRPSAPVSTSPPMSPSAVNVNVGSSSPNTFDHSQASDGVLSRPTPGRPDRASPILREHAPTGGYEPATCGHGRTRLDAFGHGRPVPSSYERVASTQCGTGNGSPTPSTVSLTTQKTSVPVPTESFWWPNVTDPALEVVPETS
jgi:hypothetical protein